MKTGVLDAVQNYYLVPDRRAGSKRNEQVWIEPQG